MPWGPLRLPRLRLSQLLFLLPFPLLFHECVWNHEVLGRAAVRLGCPGRRGCQCRGRSGIECPQAIERQAAETDGDVSRRRKALDRVCVGRQFVGDPAAEK
ncbi:MAG: hypothetical protein O3A18_03435 [Planctomycetota bacterium]|nr:hypothetical protein [Planctomycetota bacterium]